MTVKTGSIKKLSEFVQLPQAVQEKVKNFDAQLKNNPHNTAILQQKAFLLYVNQSDGQAIDILRGVIERDILCVETYVWLAELYLYHWADAEEAQAILNVALSRGLARADVYFLFACAYQKQQNFEEQSHYLRKSIEADTTFVLPCLNLIALLIDQKNIILARQELLLLKQIIKPMIPGDEMHNYYETLITGRMLSDFNMNLLCKYEQEINL